MKKGFTLMELLVVISIIAVLSTIGLITFQGTTTKTRDAVRKNDLNTLATALEIYFQKEGRYIGANDPGYDPDRCSTDTDEFYTNIAPYISGPVPTDPKTKARYCYIANSQDQGQLYKLYAKLENCSDKDITEGIDCQSAPYNYLVIPKEYVASAPSPSPIPPPNNLGLIPPTITTGSATDITYNSALLNGAIKINDNSNYVVWFKYTPKTSNSCPTVITDFFNNVSAQKTSGDAKDFNFSGLAWGLSSNTDYCFQVIAQKSNFYAISNQGVFYGQPAEFKTLSQPVSSTCSNNIYIRISQYSNNVASDTMTIWATLYRDSFTVSTQCGGHTVFFKQGSCGDSSTPIASCTVYQTGCAANFTAPSTPGTYTFSACIDKNIDGDFSDFGESNSLNIPIKSL